MRSEILKNLYFERMTSRKDQIMNASSESCSWIFSTDFAAWLAGDGHMFWLAGKPGSGKSTLMKYLARCSELEQLLPEHESGWVTTAFFFDFRLASRVGNSIEGLLRSILHQIVTTVDDKVFAGILPRLTDNISLDNLTDAFEQTFDLARQKFLILIDGLDEFDGNMRQLLKVLLGLRKHSNVKLCVASRAESMIQTMLINASIPMLYISEHNASGIREYIDSTVTEFQPDFDSLDLSAIAQTIQDRAEGVFLWVYLVFEEVLQACAEGAGTDEIMEKLNDLPTELEQLYSRILLRIAPDRRYEAAMIYELTSQAESILSVQFLQSCLQYILSKLIDKRAGNTISSLSSNQFCRRIRASMGGLVEVKTIPAWDIAAVTFNDEPKHPDADPNPNPDRDPANNGNVPVLSAALMHETVRSFFVKSAWVRRMVGEP